LMNILGFRATFNRIFSSCKFLMYILGFRATFSRSFSSCKFKAYRKKNFY
jgi:hypothetical protein